jgi:putative tryptophan/tyrosine transport system substrate-binding protein
MTIGRREFITLLGGGAAAWPLAAGAQQPALPVIGYLRSGTANPSNETGYHQGLRSSGHLEGQNVAIEYRFADGQYERLPALAADLVRRRVAMIYAGDTAAALATKAATATIPVVFAIGGDPVKIGLVTSLNRPGGNLTGASFLATDTAAKMMEVMHEGVPSTAAMALLVNPASPEAEANIREAQEAARVLGLQLHVSKAGNEGDIDTAFANLFQRNAEPLVIAGDAFFTSRMRQLVALTVRHGVPAIYQSRVFPDAGGLMSYGATPVDAYRIAGSYTGRILKGDKPADLPVQQSTKVELVINLTTAKVLGLTVPLTLLGRADEVIE